MKATIIFTTLLIALPAISQNVAHDRASLLTEIEKNNTTLAALRQKAYTDKKQNAIGNVLPDPTLGFSNTWGNKADAVTKQNFSISQEFDWGTISGLRNKATKHGDHVIDQSYQIERQKLLAEADLMIVQLIYANALCEEMAFREKRAQEIKALYDKMFTAGNANQLEVNKVHLNYMATVAEYRRAKAERDEIKDNIKRLNGNKAFSFAHASYEDVVLPTLADLLEKAKKENAQMLLAQSAIDKERQLLKLRKTENIPTLSIGYAGEIAKGDNSNGLTLGISIPIWGNNRKKIAQQRSALALAEMEKQDVDTQILSSLTMLYNKTQSLCQIAKQFRDELSINQDLSILDKALNVGQLSLIDYLNEITFYYSARTQALEADYDSQIALSELWKYFR